MALTSLLVIAAAATTVAASPDLVFKGAGWAQVGTRADMLKVYPKSARRHEVSGHVILTCEVLSDGRLTACKAEDEGPAGQGFGKAALKLAPKFVRLTDPDTARGPARPAGIVHIPILFGIPSPPAATAPAGTP